MVIPATVAKRAYEEHGRKYGRREDADPWDLSEHAKLWLHGAKAVHDGDAGSFQSLHSALRSYWGVGRGRNQEQLEPAAIHDLLRSVPIPFRKRRLSELNDGHMADLYAAVVAASAIKRNRGGASVMAMSKYLHFLNPRLFVIVDRQVVWSYVLEHDYLWHPIKEARGELEKLLPHADTNYVTGGCDLFSYVAILRWCGGLLRANPALPDIYFEYLSKSCGDKPCPSDAQEYEAAAAEWLLLGLVEIPPYEVQPGVLMVSSSRPLGFAR